MERIFHHTAAVQARRERIARFYLQGLTQDEIARRENSTQPTISKDLKAIRTAWREGAVRDFDAAREQELDKIDHLERVYWQAWDRSCQDKTRSRTKRRTGGPAVQDEAGLEREQRDGNPAYLDGVQWCIERRCKLLGLDAPERHVLDAMMRQGPGRDERDLSREELQRIARGEKAPYANGAGTNGDGGGPTHQPGEGGAGTPPA